MKYLKFLLFYLSVFLFESVFIAMSLTAIVLLYINPGIETSAGMAVLTQAALYMYIRCLTELPLAMLIIAGATYKLKTTGRDIIVSRLYPGFFVFASLVALAFDESRGFDAFMLYPVLYPGSVYISYAIYRKHLVTIINWFESSANVQTG